ncbi:MAG TPA: PilN domain-containing protein [Geobacteraceae bacterium]|nr:PilN domain-containing protein [Geobacteraceae bacterium]
MQFTINLATKKHLDYRWVTMGCIAVLVILSLLLGWNIYRFLTNQSELRRCADEIHSLQKKVEAAPPAIQEKNPDTQWAQINFYNRIIERKKFGWTELLEKVEKATPRGIALSSLAPDKDLSFLKIEGLALNFERLEDYLVRLDEAECFDDVQLLSHDEIDLWEQAHGFRFTVKCHVISP